MSKKIEIIIEEDGTIKMDAIGYEGKGCHEDLEEIRRKIQGRIKESKKKGEFYKTKVQTRVQDQIGGS